MTTQNKKKAKHEINTDGMQQSPEHGTPITQNPKNYPHRTCLANSNLVNTSSAPITLPSGSQYNKLPVTWNRVIYRIRWVVGDERMPTRHPYIHTYMMIETNRAYENKVTVRRGRTSRAVG